MWPKKVKIGGLNVKTFEPGITVTENEEIITHRNRCAVDEAKLEILRALFIVVANEDLDALFVTILSELRDLGYNLKDEPQALLARLKKQYAET